ncbi:hypothetical protein [Bradyrhizobium yuanmingense]|uniref:hypothetical protein n=1 Tax=Bradyrhizobium yuanmingense TaxID=108015 RepID=UPI0023B96760|nr:hypothetical protein [Bradyrhizobium yuanmingense]MDF0581994.1 hypothetical protein [Bradyrhizobium yuanmingense]
MNNYRHLAARFRGREKQPAHSRIKKHLVNKIATGVITCQVAALCVDGERRAGAAFNAIRETSPEIAKEVVETLTAQFSPFLRSGIKLLKANSDSGCSAIASKTRGWGRQNWDARSPASNSRYFWFSPRRLRNRGCRVLAGLRWAGMNGNALRSLTKILS